MKVRYDKLWRLTKDNKMKKSDLAKAAELSPYTMTKLNKDRPVNMEVMMNLCKVFHCDGPTGTYRFCHRRLLRSKTRKHGGNAVMAMNGIRSYQQDPEGVNAHIAVGSLP